MKASCTESGHRPGVGVPWPQQARRLAGGLAMALVCSGLSSLWAPLAPAQAEPPAIVSRVELVPVDVLVTARGGGPPPALAAADFEVYENGEARPVEYFFAGVPGSAGTGGASAESPRPDPPSNFGGPGRTFVVFLGRMGTVDPFDSLADLEIFLRRLGPDDHVALMAYNRMTPFTSRIEDVLAVLARYRAAFREIETVMQVRTDDLLGIVERDFFPDVQQRIDGIFEATGTQRNRLANGIAFPTSSSLKRLSRTDQAQGGRALMDLQNLHRAVGILDRQPGAKHLLYFSADGLFLKNPSSDHQLALAANAARVAIHTFQTGGMDSGYTRQGVGTQTALGSIRKVSDLSGGMTFIHSPVGEGLRAVDRLTRSVCTLGFVPSGSARPGEYRSIRLRVKRPGLTLHYRKNYRG